MSRRLALGVCHQPYVKLGEFRSSLGASRGSGHCEELLYDETVCLWMTIYVYILVNLATVGEGDPKTPFSFATKPKFRAERNVFARLLYLTFDTYLIMLSVNQDGIKYNFLNLWYDLTWD